MECVSGSVLEATHAVLRLAVKRGNPFQSRPSVSISFRQSSIQSHRSFPCHNRRIRRISVKAASAEYNKCEDRHVGLPLEPQSEAGRFLSRLLQNQPKALHVAAVDLLGELVVERDDVVARRELSNGSSEASLHRRIAEMKEADNSTAVEEIMYMLIASDFSKIRVPLIPRLSECTTTTGRVKIWPSKDKELEAIHRPEILSLVQDHLAGVSKYGGATQWSKVQLGRTYAASVTYGYFLTAAALRHRLEHRLARAHEDYPLGFAICVPNLDRCHNDDNGDDDDEEEFAVSIGRNAYDPVPALSPNLIGRRRRPEGLKRYVASFGSDALKLCAELRSEAAANVVEKHSLAVFGDGDGDVGCLTEEEEEEVVVASVYVSYCGLQRLLLEAVAFGTFLWKAEQLVDSIYRLKTRKEE